MEQELSAGLTIRVFIALLISSFTTELIGIHALFGAFVLGAVTPCDSPVARELPAKLKDMVAALLLPAFFAHTGMRMQIGLLNDWFSWGWCLIVILVATAGNFRGTVGAAR